MTDIIGMRFNRWLVLSPSHSIKRRWFFNCRCDCGTERTVRKDQLTSGISKSCGCWKREVAKAHIISVSTTHGHANKTRTYAIWKEMRKRCLNPRHKSYANYGGRGIGICKRWTNYANFLKDMGEVSNDGLSLDRIDNNGNYEPGNCRWATKKTQANNTRTNIYYKHNGELLSLKQWTERSKLPYLTVYQRIFKLGWSFKKAITEPVEIHKR